MELSLIFLVLSPLIGYSLGCLILKGLIKLVGFNVSIKEAFRLPIKGFKEWLKSIGG